MVKKVIMPHWYSKKRSKLRRRKLYLFIRLFGFSHRNAVRVRDWSYNHIALFIASNYVIAEEVKKNEK